ncbi:MAG TPA: HAD family hydrolase [Thermodesulfobacteriota bacterium]|nr:HAD family hydrolase [Thermodesulfobacteriota bacterium]
MSFSHNHLKAMIFDFDGTLAVLNIDFGLMKERVLQWMKRFGVLEERIKERYLLEIIDEVYRLLLEEGNTSGAERFYHGAHLILQTVEFEAAGDGTLIPGSRETLTFIRQRGIKVGIITRNCDGAVRKVFPNIDAYCDVFVSRDSVKRVKPHPDHLVSVMKALKVSEEDAVMIGDHVLDIQAGKRVGMKTVGVLTGRIKKEEFEKAGADYILRDVSEIRQLLEDQR